MKTNPDLIKVMMQDLGILTPEEHEAELKEFLSMFVKDDTLEIELPLAENEEEDLQIPA